MALYRKKPVAIEAVQIPLVGAATEADAIVFRDFLAGSDWMPDGDGLAIVTLEGTMRGDPGDWIIKGVQGEYYPCKPDIFALTYEPAE